MLIRARLSSGLQQPALDHLSCPISALNIGYAMSRPRDFLGPYRLVRLIRVGNYDGGLGSHQDGRSHALCPEDHQADCRRTRKKSRR